MLADAERFNAAIARFDAANADDPTTEVFQGAVYPKELLYAQRMTTWLDKLAPDASEALRLAVRCQHIQRWTIPRHTYADGPALATCAGVPPSPSSTLTLPQRSCVTWATMTRPSGACKRCSAKSV